MKNPTKDKRLERVYRGSGWNDLSVFAQVFKRDYGYPDYGGNRIGLRLVRNK